jgi:hypothetical protein
VIIDTDIKIPLLPVRHNSNIPYLIAIFAMALIGIGGTLIVLVLRPHEDNAALYVAIAGFTVPTIASLAAFIKTQETHTLVNGQMTQYRKVLELNAGLAAQLAREQGLSEGLREHAALLAKVAL